MVGISPSTKLFSRSAKFFFLSQFSREIRTNQQHNTMKVVVCGAAGGIGQPLALLLKAQLPSGSFFFF